MRLLYPLGLLLLLGLIGCSGIKGKDLEGAPATVSQGTPSDDLPLLRRESAKEVWERSQRPLPPLPVKQKAAPVPEVFEALTSVIAAPKVFSSTEENTPEIEAIPSLDVEIPANSMDSGGTPRMSTLIEQPGEPKTTVIPWGEEAEPVGVQPSLTVSLNKVTPDSLPEVLRAYRGKVLLVNCWGIDCGPCIEELPYLEQISREFKDQGLKVLAINTDVQRRWPEVERFVNEKGFTFNVVLKAPGPDTKFRAAVDPEYGADPFTVIYNRQGKKIYTIADALTLTEWREAARAVVAGRPIPITKENVIRWYE